MPSLLQEEVGVAFAGATWLIGDFKLWESTQTDVILYSLQQPTLALNNQTQQHQVSVTAVHQWQQGIDQLVNGSLSFVVTVLPQQDQAAFEQLKQTWSQALHNRGYSRSQSLKFLPLPMRNLHAQVELANSIGKVSTPTDLSTGETCTFLVELTQSGATAWTTALEQRKIVPNAGIQFTYEYPQQLPEMHISVQIHGNAVYDASIAMLDRQQNGTYVGTRSQVLAALEAMIQDEQIEVQLTPLLPSEQQKNQLKTLLGNIYQAILDALFIAEISTSDSSSMYALKWKKSADAFDFSFQVNIAGGWTWLQGAINGSFTNLFAGIDSRYLNTVYLERSFPVSITIQGDPMLQTVALTWSADEGIPQAIVFNSTGGKRDVVLTSRNPDAVMIQFQAKLSFTPAKWSPIELRGQATVAQGGNQIVLRPGDLVRRVMFHLLVREGSRIKPAANLPPNDSIVVNVTYKGDHLATPIKTSSRITPIAPVQFTYLRDPQNRPTQLLLSAIGTLNNKLVRVADQTIRTDETDVYLLLEHDRLQLVSRNSVISEADALAQQLLEAGLRPIVSS